MTLFDRLSAAAVNGNALNSFLSHNSQEIIDWFNRLPHDELKMIQPSFRRLVLLQNQLFNELPLTSGNIAFLAMLMEKAEQLGEISAFQQLYSIVKETFFDIGHRLRAAALYMDIPKEVETYIFIFNEIYGNLQIAFLDEEDSADKVLFTLVNYYIQVIDNCGQFNKGVPLLLKNNIEKALADGESSFLNCSLIHDVLRTELINTEAASIHIRTLLDLYLERTVSVINLTEGLLVEEGTEYSELLRDVEPDFAAIRAISVKKHQENPQGQRFYDRLQRGVKVLDDERELYAYMVAMGNMHAAKLTSGFDEVNFETVEGIVNIVDWGCGQGTGTMVLLDYLQSNDIHLDIHQIVLIEPSEVAIKRGSLHTLKYDHSVNLHTINNVIDGLHSTNFKQIEGTTIHIFANILDIDAVSLSPLTSLVKTTFPGENIFVCTSPYLNGLKTNRLNNFMTSFENDNLEVLASQDNTKGTWKAGWSRVLRVFKAKF